MNLLFMVLHGDCPNIKSGEQPPKMAMVKMHPDGKTADFHCYGCDALVRFTQRIISQPVRAAVVESPRLEADHDPSAP